MLQEAVGAAAEAWPRNEVCLGILVVEDEPLLLEMMAETLDTAGLRVSVAANAAEALARLQGREPIGILFTDIDMPGGMDGYALAREARALNPAIRVVYTSGRRPFLETGGAVADSTFVAKPYRPLQVTRFLAGLARTEDVKMRSAGASRG